MRKKRKGPKPYKKKDQNLDGQFRDFSTEDIAVEFFKTKILADEGFSLAKSGQDSEIRKSLSKVRKRLIKLRSIGFRRVGPRRFEAMVRRVFEDRRQSMPT